MANDPRTPHEPRSAAVTAPANLLLLGEYAVLEEGGLGLACAPEVRAHGYARSAASPRVHGRMPSGDLVWPGDTGVLGGVAQWLREHHHAPECEFGVDTSRFFMEDGRKRGLGSSAALSVVLTALWLRMEDRHPAGRTGNAPPVGLVVREAVQAHRAAQGGRGSGYDVAASAHGGFVLFRGGVRPHAQRIDLPWLPRFSLFAGRDAVATRGAVSRYREWKASHRDEADRFLERSNELVRDFVGARSWADALPAFEEYRELTRRVGEEIGVPATITPPSGHDPALCKALGAGNEIGVSFRALLPEEAIEIAREGLVWE